MKLLVVFPSKNRGGAEEYALTIASHAIEKTWEVTAAFPKTDETESLRKDFQQREITYYPLNIAPVSGKYLKLFREYIPQFIKSVRLLRRVKPDVIHLTIAWPYWGFSTLLACAFLNIPTVVSFQLFYRYFFYTKIRLKLFHWARQRNQVWVAISDNNRQFISQSFQVPVDSLIVIYNGAKSDSDLMNLTSEQQEILRRDVCQEIGVSKDSKILLTVGRLHKQKGYHELIEIARPLIQTFPEVKFIWVGEGGLRNYLEQKIKQYNLESSIVLMGYRQDVSRFLIAADLFIFPTQFEGGQSFAVSEAMAHGLPIIVSDASGMPEIIRDKIDGLLFPKQDKEALLNSIIWGLENLEEMKKMADNAQKRVQDFSEDKMVDQTLALLEKITS